ncbi:FAM172 family protein homolog CG10038 isoform X2 [Procambarus clarkii]|uniref:FAM172 family protein homolog CG10038 isoform X2 n=1 Tax=Procambarus clarkii TaxID=6728 RepID=UPI001E6772DE|nr:cotranscriptional regulator FAM172A homolog isoform X2 [Procambarus clarkii]
MKLLVRLFQVLTEEVYKYLEKDCKLKRVPVPFNANDDEPSTFIFISEDAMSNPEKILVLIHGSGVVRAGQWSRRLIINDSLDSGTQIPFIKKAQEEGYGIIVMNTNDNYRTNRKKNRSRIRGSENPDNHALHVWDNYIRDSKAKHIGIIAHSYGGCVTTNLFTRKKDEFVKRVFAVAMTDSVHFIPSPVAFKELVKVSCNWVCSQHPLDTPVSTQPGDIRRVSSGVTIHEMTSWASFGSIFKFLRQRLDAAPRADDVEDGGDDYLVFAKDGENAPANDGDTGGDDGAAGTDDGDAGANGGDAGASEGDTGANDGDTGTNDGDDVCDYFIFAKAGETDTVDDEGEGSPKKCGHSGDSKEDDTGVTRTSESQSDRAEGEGATTGYGGHDISDDEQKAEADKKKMKLNT